MDVDIREFYLVAVVSGPDKPKNGALYAPLINKAVRKLCKMNTYTDISGEEKQLRGVCLCFCGDKPAQVVNNTQLPL